MKQKSIHDNMTPLQWGLQMIVEMHHALDVDVLAALYYVAFHADLIEALYEEDITPGEAIGDLAVSASIGLAREIPAHQPVYALEASPLVNLFEVKPPAKLAAQKRKKAATASAEKGTPEESTPETASEEAQNMTSLPPRQWPREWIERLKAFLALPRANPIRPMTGYIPPSRQEEEAHGHRH